eukprot:gene13492-9653_t
MFALFALVLVALAAVVSSQAVGGWFPVDTAQAEVQQAVSFAVTHKYPNETPTVSVVSAMRQVVAGLKIDVTAEITIGGVCHVDHYQVWNHFGTLSAVVSDTMTTECGTTVTGNGVVAEPAAAASAQAHKSHFRKATH